MLIRRNQNKVKKEKETKKENGLDLGYDGKDINAHIEKH